MSDEAHIIGEWPPAEDRGKRRKGVGHSTGFELALENALVQWTIDYQQTMTVSLEIDITDNPGGIGTYRVILKPSG